MKLYRIKINANLFVLVVVTGRVYHQRPGDQIETARSTMDRHCDNDCDDDGVHECNMCGE